MAKLNKIHYNEMDSPLLQLFSSLLLYVVLWTSGNRFWTSLNYVVFVLVISKANIFKCIVSIFMFVRRYLEYIVMCIHSYLLHFHRFLSIQKAHNIRKQNAIFEGKHAVRFPFSSRFHRVIALDSLLLAIKILAINPCTLRYWAH